MAGPTLPEKTNIAMERLEARMKRTARRAARKTMDKKIAAIHKLWEKRRYRRLAKRELSPKDQRAARLAVKRDPAVKAISNGRMRFVNRVEGAMRRQQEADYRELTAMLAAEASTDGADALWVVTQEELADLRRAPVHGIDVREALRLHYNKLDAGIRRGLTQALTEENTMGSARLIADRAVSSAYDGLIGSVETLAGELSALTTRMAIGAMGQVEVVAA